MSKIKSAVKVLPPNPGILLLPSLSLQPVAYNREAVRLLDYPNSPDEVTCTSADLAKRIGDKLVSRSSKGKRKFVGAFKSGNRTYVCRILDVTMKGSGTDDRDSVTTLLLLERLASPSRLLERMAWEEFGLTRRERQIVVLLIDGMTTKEIARELNLSPNTIKSYLRLIMRKMSVSTRSGIVGKVLDRGRA